MRRIDDRGLGVPATCISTTARIATAAVLTTLCAASPPLDAAPGDPLGPAFRVNTVTTGEQQQAVVARDASGNFVVTWESNDGSLSGIFAQRYAADGTPRAGQFQVNTYTDDRQIAPDVAMDAVGNFVITWRSSSQDGFGGGIYGRRFRADGVAQGGEFLVNNRTIDSQSEPQVAMNASGAFAVVWSERTVSLDLGLADRRSIYARSYRANGAAQGAQVQVATVVGPRILTPGVGIADDGRFIATWFHDGTPNRVYARHFLSSGAANGASFVVGTAASGLLLDLPTVAMNSAGELVIAWEATRAADGSRAGIFGRRYTSPRAGAPPPPNSGALGDSFRMDTDVIPLGRSSVAMDAAGRFTVTGDADGQGIYLRRFNGAAVALTAPVPVAPGTFSPLFSRVATSVNGSLVVTWHSFLEDGAGRGVYARRFEAP
ncbi:MAG: hypothetical protein ACT4QA_13525 [Panacagrimonas sp.]